MSKSGYNVQKPRLFRLLLTLNPRELTAFDQFLRSPYFNQREDLIVLFDHLRPRLEAGSGLDRAQLWSLLYPNAAYDDQRLRLLMSYLARLVEQFLTVEGTLADPFERKMQVARHLRARNADSLHDHYLKAARRALEKQPLRNAEYWLRSYRHREAAYRRAFAHHPEQDDEFALLGPTVDRAFLAVKLRQGMWLLNHERLYQWGYRPTPLDAYIARLDPETFAAEPALQLYYQGMKVLQSPTDEAVFQRFTETLFTHAGRFPEEEARDLYLLAINFGVRQVNEGREGYFTEVMALYRNGLQQGYLLRDGVLSRFTYHNIVSTALRIGESAWAETFIEEWTAKLDRRYRDRMYHFSRAKIAYADRRYADALPLLQQANYHDSLLNLGARTLLLKIYFDLEEWEVLESHLDAFRNYLRRKPGITYHRANYRNLIRYTRRLLKTRHAPAEERARLRERILNEEPLTERRWLLERV